MPGYNAIKNINEWLVLIRDVNIKPFLKAYDEAKKFETDITDRSTKGDKSKQYSILTESLKSLGSLFHNYIKNVKGVGHRDLKIGTGWCVEGDKGSYHRLHNHTLVRENSKLEVIDQIKALKELHDKGILNDDEFKKAKDKILK